MASPLVFPALSGLGWSVHKKPIFSTQIATHASGREVRNPLYLNPLWEWEVLYDGLDSGSGYAGLGANSMQQLLGFFMLAQGQFGTFLYIDPTDKTATAQTLGYGDGSTTAFTAVRVMGGQFLEPVGWLLTITGVAVAGVTQSSSAYSIQTPNQIVFASAPASGALVSASFTYAFQCRFTDDTADFEEFMSDCWRVDSLKFRSVRSA